MADTAASEPHATSALADERLIVQRRRSQDDAAPCGDERRPTEDDGSAEERRAIDREAHDAPQLDPQEAPLG